MGHRPAFARSGGRLLGSGLCCVCLQLLGRAAVAQDSVDEQLEALEQEAQSNPVGPASPAAAPPPAPAGDQPPPDAEPGDSLPEDSPPPEDVVTVTGSRIKRKSIASSAPVTVIGTSDMLAVGRPSVAEILQRLPAQANAINLQFNNGGTGTARINLRSLGVERTLVLVNGRRFVPGGDGANSSVDLNAIPASIIERIEVLKDGGSAVYGSDAIAGVVNIITKKNFTGVEANAYNSITQRGDGRVYQVDLTGGISSTDGRSNLLFSVQFLDQQPIFAGERDFSRYQRLFDWDAFAAAGRPDHALYLSNAGSSAVPGGRVLDATGAPGNAAWDALGCRFSTCQNGSARAGDLGAGWRLSGGDEDLYNFQPENYLSTPYQRLSLFAQGNYRISDYLGFFFEGSFTRRDAKVELAPEPFLTLIEEVPVSADNRYNPFGRDFQDVRRRMVEGGNRLFSREGTVSRVVVGMEGDIPTPGLPGDWSWEAYLNYGRTDTTVIREGLYNRPRLAAALGPDSECVGDCVPLDLFGGPGTITQDMLDYVSIVGVDNGYSSQYVAAANVSGPLFHLSSDEPVAVSAGYQFRREGGADTPNPLTAAGDVTGNKREPTAGSYRLGAFYAEVSAPLVSHRPGVEHLELTAAARLTTIIESATYKLGLRYNPNDWFALRGTVTTAFRTPSVAELYGGGSDSFPNVSDPCSPLRGNLDNPTVAENCAADGYDDGVPDDRTQLPARIGGSEDLEPETADTFTVGVVLEDRLIRGLTASVDYYSIAVDNAVQSVGAGTILAGCYQQEGANRAYCERIQRDGNGFIQNIIDSDSNVGGFRARGIDVGLRYDTAAFGFGRLGAGIDGTILVDLTQIQADGFEQSYAGNYDQASGGSATQPGANPRYRLTSFVRWAFDIYNAGLNFRYLPGFQECEGGPCNVDSAEQPVERTVNDYKYFDLFAGVDLLSPLGATSVTAGINNLTDTTPPYIANGFLAESDAATYDYAGRSFYLRLTQQF